jgi:hypothetical protein
MNSVGGQRGALFKGGQRREESARASGDAADAWRKRHEQGGSLQTIERHLASSGPNPEGTCNVHHARAAGRTRGRGEADGWAAATVPGGGDTDGRGLLGSGSGREGCEWRAGARGPAREEKKGWSSPDEQ